MPVAGVVDTHTYALRQHTAEEKCLMFSYHLLKMTRYSKSWQFHTALEDWWITVHRNFFIFIHSHVTDQLIYLASWCSCRCFFLVPPTFPAFYCPCYSVIKITMSKYFSFHHLVLSMLWIKCEICKSLKCFYLNFTQCLKFFTERLNEKVVFSASPKSSAGCWPRISI